MRKNTALSTVLFFSLYLIVGIASAATVSSPTVVNQLIELDIEGPTANEADSNPNPFLDIRFDLFLTSPSGQSFTVPGFFAGNGKGAGDGNVWRARFTADEIGSWQYTAALYQGNNAAVADDLELLTNISPDNNTGTFNVAANTNTDELVNRGRLEYVGEHYLKFTNGSYWIKGGVDSPENFFGYIGFDNTVNQDGGVGEAQLPNGLHAYADHIADWNAGDPLFSSADSGVDSKGIIGAVNYLASEGVNSMYFLLMNLGGDGRETYPFIGASGSHNDNTHYDVSKLHQWNIVLKHMQSKGVAAHLVLGEQEEDNKLWLDNGELGVQRKLYYRELVARFTHLHALKWNISEESRYGDARHKSFAQYLSVLDWAQHPIAVHSFVDAPDKAYNALLGDELFRVSSIQFSAENADQFTESWRQQSADAGIPWVIDMDEVGPGSIGLTESNSEQMRRDVLYPVYFSGGNIEWYFGFQGADIRTENFRTREPMYRYMRYAREFMQTHLPFWEMQPMDDAISGGHSNDQVFAKPGDTYAIYLNQASTPTTLSVPPGDYTIAWFNPRTGTLSPPTPAISGDALSGDSLPISGVPSEPEQDWVVLVKRASDPTPTNGTDGGQTGSDNEGESTVEPPVDVESNEEPPLAAANEAPSGGGYTNAWSLILILALYLNRLLFSFRCRRVLTVLFNMLCVERIKINRVE